MPVNFIIQSENVKARQEESTMKIRKYACIAISAALLMTGCQATPDQDIVANKNDNQASQEALGQLPERSRTGTGVYPSALRTGI